MVNNLNNIDLESLSDEELIALDEQLAAQENTQQPQMTSIDDLEAMSDEELLALDQQLAEQEKSSNLSESEKLLQQSDQLDAKIVNANEKEYNALESGVMGTVQGVSLGGADEIGGALKTAYDVATGDASISQLSEQYEKNRKALSDEFKRAEQDNPEAFLAGDVVGGVGTMFVPGLGALKGIKGAATLGGVSGFLRSEKDISGRVTDGVLMGVFGAGIAGAANLAGTGLNKLGQKAAERSGLLKQKYEQQIIAKSLGFTDEVSANNLNIILKSKGLSGIEAINDVAKEVGLFPSASKGGYLVNTPEQLSKNIKRAKKGYGGILEDIFDDIDNVTGGPSINPLMLMQKIRNQRSIAKELRSDAGYVVKETKEFLDEILVPLQEESMWSVKRLWEYRTDIRRSMAERALDGEGLTKRKLADKLHDDLGYFLDEIIKSSHPIAGKIDKKLYREASSQYAKLSTLEKILNENVETIASGASNGLRRSIQLAPLLNAKTLAAGALGGTPAFIAAGVLDSYMKTPFATNMASKAYSKIGSVLTKNNKYASTLIDAASRSDAAFNKVLGAGEAMYDFTQKPLARNTDEVLRNLPKILNIMDVHVPEIADQLREAAESNDRDAIAGIMSLASLDPKASQYIEQGLGWDGKAITEGDIKDTEAMIKGSQASSIQKSQLMAQFSQDRVIPQVQPEKPFYKVYDPELKTKIMK